jgi:hypothetical protein
MKKLAFCVLTCLFCSLADVTPAFAGDGATIIFKSGTLVYVSNGYQQIVSALKEFNKKGTDNYNMEVNIEDATFFINLGTVAIVCRDRCKSMEILSKKDKDGRDGSN